jgi:hypothetical protein
MINERRDRRKSDVEFVCVWGGGERAAMVHSSLSNKNEKQTNTRTTTKYKQSYLTKD